MSIEPPQEYDAKVRKDLNMQRLLRRMRGTGPRTTGTGAFFLVGRGPVPRNRCLILGILQILAILIQTRILQILIQTPETLARDRHSRYRWHPGPCRAGSPDPAMSP